MSELEDQEIRVIIKNGRYHISRHTGVKVKEQYAPTDNRKAQVFLASILNGFQPPRSLLCLDRLSD